MSERHPANLQLNCWNWEVFLNLVRHFIQQQPDHCIPPFLAHHYPRLRLKKTSSRLEIQKSHNIWLIQKRKLRCYCWTKDVAFTIPISRHLAYTEGKATTVRQKTWRHSFADFFAKPVSLVFMTYIVINVLKIRWLQYQTAQPLWPTRLERNHQGP